MFENDFNNMYCVSLYYKERAEEENIVWGSVEPVIHSWVYFLSIDDETKIGFTRQNPVKRWGQFAGGQWRLNRHMRDFKFAAYNCHKLKVSPYELEQDVHYELRSCRKYHWSDDYERYLGPMRVFQGSSEIFKIPIEEAAKAAYNLLRPSQLEFSF